MTSELPTSAAPDSGFDPSTTSRADADPPRRIRYRTTPRWWLRVKRAALLPYLSGVFACGVATGIVLILDADEPVYGGTYTQEMCVEGASRLGCRSLGHWVSDDGRQRLDAVYLEEYSFRRGSIRAFYQPTGIWNDADSGTVQTSEFRIAQPLLAAGLAIGPAVIGIAAVRRWRRSPVPRIRVIPDGERARLRRERRRADAAR
ncbi:hypothetical protein ACFWZW_12160 [Microbacterium enclense]|uniref:hypothetical protein n=1 Tax=Microbacterium enclense TaxID=993073 RepID=UPI0036D83F38